MKKDIFISYAHRDNQPLPGEDAGWVTNFSESLNSFLTLHLNQRFEIWQDDKRLQGNTDFSKEIEDQLAEMDLFVAVLTDKYLKSEWCNREIHTFCEEAQEALFVGNTARVFKVKKLPVPPEEQDPLPKEVQGLLGYDFFVRDEKDLPLPLDPAFGDDVRKAYLRQLNTMSAEMAKLLEEAGDRNVNGRKENEKLPDKPVVYLAECDYEQDDVREQIRGELEARNYTVLPDRELPRGEEAYVKEVKQLLGRCQLSIHLVGHKLEWGPKGPTRKSAVEWQNELAVQRIEEEAGALRRVIWAPKQQDAAQQEVPAFVNRVYEDEKVQFGADVITGPIKELKAAIDEALRKIEEPEPEPGPETEAVSETPAGPGKIIYLICNKEDRKATIPLVKFLKTKGFSVKLPLFTGDAAKVQARQEEYLLNCDAVILFYGAGDEYWRDSIDNELIRMEGFRDDKPPLVRYTYLAGPLTEDNEDDKEFLLETEDNVMDGRDGFPEAMMDSFVNAVQ